jgi:hypothetical protein
LNNPRYLRKRKHGYVGVEEEEDDDDGEDGEVYNGGLENGETLKQESRVAVSGPS